MTLPAWLKRSWEGPMMNERLYHMPVLLNESIEALMVQPDGTYVDVTFGGGGYSRHILDKLDRNGRIIAFDQDPDAGDNVPEDDRFTLIPWNFRYMQKMLRATGVTVVDGLVADLGVSSHQFDEQSRGFTYRASAPLDMRMDMRMEFTAADLLREYTIEQLQEMFSRNAELRNARQLALAIDDYRRTREMLSTGQLVEVAESVMKGDRFKYLAQVFQAIRIEVNDELGALEEMLKGAAHVLKPGGRLVVISYHSLEDRIVKKAIRNEWDDAQIDPVKGGKEVVYKVITRKAVKASAEEVKANPRSASAIMRVAEKC